ncbi:MAG TPA: hypothetical protein VKA48_08940 [Gammaproteobacteria bacterium]|nr:hypothetical protein [Gammaproteobacteria bacterium]
MSEARWNGLTVLALSTFMVGLIILGWVLMLVPPTGDGNLRGLAIVNILLALVFGPFAVTLDRLLSAPGQRGKPRTHLAICGTAFLVILVNAGVAYFA